MNILMMTNTYLPHVGGVARSVSAFTEEYRKRGHRVVVVAPEYKNVPEDNRDVIRVPAIQNFNGSDFAVILPIPGAIQTGLKDFKPDIIHSHHPFLIGGTAVRIASKFQVPLVYTHHTLFEQYLHYFLLDVPQMKTFVVNLSCGYAGLADHVIAPSRSVADFLKDHGVNTPISVIPTGICVERFRSSKASGLRRELGIDNREFVIGHVGRLAPEKNLAFLTEAVAAFLETEPHARFLIVGTGPMQEDIRRILAAHKLEDRLCMPGKLEGPALIDAYHAMDVFAFASTSETQGLVLAEAMAAGLPVTALRASGAVDIIKHRRNGFLVTDESSDAFAAGLRWFHQLSPVKRKVVKNAALKTAMEFSISKSADKALALYKRLCRRSSISAQKDESLWHTSLEQIKAEWDVFSNFSSAVSTAMKVSDDSAG